MLRHTTQNHTDFNVCILYVSVCTSNSARMTYEMIDHERHTTQIKITLTLMYASVSSVHLCAPTFISLRNTRMYNVHYTVHSL